MKVYFHICDQAQPVFFFFNLPPALRLHYASTLLPEEVTPNRRTLNLWAESWSLLQNSYQITLKVLEGQYEGASGHAHFCMYACIHAHACWNLMPGRTLFLLRSQQCCLPNSKRYVMCCILFSALASSKLSPHMIFTLGDFYSFSLQITSILEAGTRCNNKWTTTSQMQDSL